MPNWTELLDEIERQPSTCDAIRHKYVENLHNVTGRNVIVYYSGWLQKANLLRQGVSGFELNDSDKNGFMAAIHHLDRSKGLDLVLHTPGGDTAATESLVDYLHSMFNDIRAIIPQLALSAGTMIAMSCNQILMGKHSSLGPIDPQIYGIPAHGVLEEFDRAAKEISADQSKVLVWQPIISKYNATLIGECQKAIDWSKQIARDWLKARMFAADPNADDRAKKVVEEFSDHQLTKSHARHISIGQAKAAGLDVQALEDDQKLQDAVLTLHHACVYTLSATPAIKLIENQLGVAYVPSHLSA